MCKTKSGGSIEISYYVDLRIHNCEVIRLIIHEHQPVSLFTSSFTACKTALCRSSVFCVISASWMPTNLHAWYYLERGSMYS